METLTGLEPLESRRDTKVIIHSDKFKRMGDHPMYGRVSRPTKSRLKRVSFRVSKQGNWKDRTLT